jgi:hypothetical protein
MWRAESLTVPASLKLVFVRPALLCGPFAITGMTPRLA